MSILNLIKCNAETGEITWAVDYELEYRKRIYLMKANTPVNFRETQGGYLNLAYKRKPYYASRLMWEAHNGPIPKGFHIDHKNGIKKDNRLCNLRLCSPTQNCLNRPTRRDSRTGVKGVGITKAGTFVANVVHNKVRHWLGCYPTLEEAASVVRAFREAHHGEFVNHGTFNQQGEAS